MPDALDWVMLVFLFALGACLGSFLNVVVLRLPDIEIPPGASPFEIARRQLHGLSYPPSRCPRCAYQLRWYDNFPVFGWIWLGGKCRSCQLPISVRYPLVEALTGLLFAGFYVTFFLLGPQWGPPTPARQVEVASPLPHWQVEELPPAAQQDLVAQQLPPEVAVAEVLAVPTAGGTTVLLAWVRSATQVMRDWPMLVIVLTLTWCLLAASMIDAVHFYIPRWLSYLPAVVGLGLHTIYDTPWAPLSLMVGPVGCAWAIGGGVGWVLALGLVRLGVIRRSYAEQMPLLEVEREAAGQGEPTAEEWAAMKRLVRRETLREMAFLALPLGLGLLCALSAAYGPGQEVWQSLAGSRAASAFCGSLLGGLVGGGVIWGVRVLGSLGFGREAMGLGDADLMFGVGCCLGAGPAAIALFPAAVIGLVFALYGFVTRRRHEMPFGPYLALASLGLVILWNPLADWLRPSLAGLGFLLGRAAPLLGLG